MEISCSCQSKSYKYFIKWDISNIFKEGPRVRHIYKAVRSSTTMFVVASQSYKNSDVYWLLWIISQWHQGGSAGFNTPTNICEIPRSRSADGMLTDSHQDPTLVLTWIPCYRYIMYVSSFSLFFVSTCLRHWHL